MTVSKLGFATRSIPLSLESHVGVGVTDEFVAVADETEVLLESAAEVVDAGTEDELATLLDIAFVEDESVADEVLLDDTIVEIESAAYEDEPVLLDTEDVDGESMIDENETVLLDTAVAESDAVEDIVLLVCTEAVATYTAVNINGSHFQEECFSTYHSRYR